MGMTVGQRQLHKLLIEFDKICRDNNLTYYAAGGTIIGAIRHRGFLPWDDDVDLYMTRDEFNKLVEVAKNGGFPEGRYMACQELDREYTNVFGRYLDTTATAIHRSQLVSNDIAGSILDVFQLDPVPDDKKILEQHFELLLIYSDLINENAPYIHRTDLSLKKYKYYMKYAKKYGKIAALEKIEEQLLCYKEEDCHLYFMRWGGAPLIFDRSMFSEVKYADMEGIAMPIPVNFNEYLTYHYSDEWEQVPNITQQMSHDAVHNPIHDEKVIKRSYMTVIDKSHIEEINRKNKANKIQTAHIKHYVADHSIRFRGARVREELIRTVKKSGADLASLYKKRDYSKLNSLFMKYYTLQNSAQFSGRDTYSHLYRYQKPFLIDLPEDIFTIAMKVQMDCGRASKTFRTLEIYELEKGALPKGLQSMKDAVYKMRLAKNHFYLEEYKRAMSVAEEVLKKFPFNSEMIKLYVRSAIGSGEENKLQAKLLERGLKTFPEDGDFMKLKADTIYSVDKDKAVKLYQKARNHTANGIILLEIGDVLKDHFNDLLSALSDEYVSGRKEMIRQLEKKLKKVDDSPAAELEIMAVRAESLPDAETSYSDYKELSKRIGNDAFESDSGYKERLEYCLFRTLSLCGEVPFVSTVHIKVLFGEMTLEGICGIIDEAKEKNLEAYIPELKKYKADILLGNGDIRGAYEEYSEVLYELPVTCVAYKDLKEHILSDNDHFQELEKLDPSLRDQNISVKYGTEDDYNKILSYLDSEGMDIAS